MGPGGMLMGLRGMLKPLLMISPTVTVGCVAVRFRGVLMIFGGLVVFFSWHCFTPFGIYPLSKSDESQMSVVVPHFTPAFMRPTKKN
jgi:hypothetical protein